MIAKQVLSDLIWVINSPSLIGRYESPPFALESNLELDEGQLDERFKYLHDYHRLGGYFEDLVEVILTATPEYRFIGRNLPIFDDERTVGEIDFLISRPDGEFEHWETAVKFYLYHRSGIYFGPNSNDTLERKARKLFDHQLRLLEKSSSLEQISERTGEEVTGVATRLLTRGVLFYPWGQTLESVDIPEYLNPGHSFGRWLYRSEMMKLQQLDSDFVILEKRDWLSGNSLNPPISLTELRNEVDQRWFKGPARPLMVKTLNTKAERVFICPPDWPRDPSEPS